MFPDGLHVISGSSVRHRAAVEQQPAGQPLKMGRRADSIFILREEDAGELGKKVAEPVTGPVPIPPVINELQNVRRLVYEESYSLPRRAAGAEYPRTKRPAVRRRQPLELGALYEWRF